MCLVFKYLSFPCSKNIKNPLLSARLKRPKIVCSPSYVDFRSRANAAMWLDLDHMTRGRAHTGDIGIGRNSKHESV
jgi:hypothetical protein